MARRREDYPDPEMLVPTSNGTRAGARKRKRPQWEIEMQRQERLAAKDKQIAARDWRPDFVKELASHMPLNLTRAAQRAGVPYSTAKKEIAANPEMQDVIEEMKQAMRDGVWEVAWKMGIEGEKEDIFFMGEVVGYRIVRNPNMTQFVAKALDPETFDSKTRAARINASSLTDAGAKRQQMMAGVAERFAMFDGAVKKMLTGEIVDVEPLPALPSDD